MFSTKQVIAAALLAAASLAAAGVGRLRCQLLIAEQDRAAERGEPDPAAPRKPEEAAEKGDGKQALPDWGKAVKGLQARLHAEKLRWPAGETPKLVLDVRNQGTAEVSASRVDFFAEVEVDGTWFRNRKLLGPIDVKSSFLRAGAEVDDWVTLSLDDSWCRATRGPLPEPLGMHLQKPLRLSPGKHTIRVAFPFEGGIRPVSGAVEITVEKGAPQQP